MRPPHIALALSLVTLHRPDGTEVVVNPRQVTSLHSPRDGKLLPHGQCAIWLSDGKLVVVIEPCGEVKRLLETTSPP